MEYETCNINHETGEQKNVFYVTCFMFHAP